VVSCDGTGLRVLTGPQCGDNPTWSPDGNAIAFDRSPEFGRGGIATINPDGSNVHEICPLGRPDGSQLVFERSGTSGSSSRP
jgi:Tol biopolymer transport system component